MKILCFFWNVLLKNSCKLLICTSLFYYEKNCGFEAKVIGAIFNPENSGKVIKEAIAGQSGVFVLQPGTISATPVANADVAQQRSMMQAQARQMSMYRSPVEALKNTADIKDNRSRFY